MNEAKTPTEVPDTGPAKQVGDTVHQRWAWVEASVWTPRMLKALEEGVKGGVWFALMDKVEAEGTLRAAFDAVWRNDGSAGVDAQSVRGFEEHEQKELARLRAQLRAGTYRPLPVRRVYIPKPGSVEKRPLGIPAVRDRVVQGALKAVMEPIFERQFAPQSYGFRPGRGCKDALRRVEELLKAGYTHVVDADLKSYFDTIPHARLLERVKTRIADGRVLKLIASFLEARVLEEMRQWQPESGTPQGGVISPLLANIYLNPLDHEMVQAGLEMVRYADDFVILCRSEAEAQRALEHVQRWCQAEGLTLHEQKTRLVDALAPGGFDFLGYHFERGMRWPRRQSMWKLRERVRARTRRTSGESLECIITRLNASLRGWFAYFQHSKPNTFAQVDGWVRGRLRSILRQRAGRRGLACGQDHHRYQNAFFAAAGLFSLRTAWIAVRQSHD